MPNSKVLVNDFISFGLRFQETSANNRVTAVTAAYNDVNQNRQVVLTITTSLGTFMVHSNIVELSYKDNQGFSHWVVEQP